MVELFLHWTSTDVTLLLPRDVDGVNGYLDWLGEPDVVELIVYPYQAGE